MVEAINVNLKLQPNGSVAKKMDESASNFICSAECHHSEFIR